MEYYNAADLDLFAPSLGTDEHINDLMVECGLSTDDDNVRFFANQLLIGVQNVIDTAESIDIVKCSECGHRDDRYCTYWNNVIKLEDFCSKGC